MLGFSFYLISQGASFKFIFSESVSAACFYLISLVAIKNLGLVGAPIGYALNALLSLVILTFCVRSVYSKQ